jgi:hypothetical protein
MENSKDKELCMKLLLADSEEEVISILKRSGYWENPKVWRLIGDREGNFSTIGNQASKPEAALTEKVVNAIDARLMNECLVRGIDPKGPNAPRNMRGAVSRFFDEKEASDTTDWTIRKWDDKRRREVSEGITVVLTGDKRKPSVTISDIGEGQTPEMMPDTFLSIDKQNKLSIFFVQGTFNMGGMGVLQFCGTHNIQLIITKRNPKIIQAMNEQDPSSEYWGFTIVRRQSPPEAVKSSVYTYLAPVGVETKPSKGSVLRFKAESLTVMPVGNKPYIRESEWGSTIKLYNYDMRGFASHACMKDGLLYRLGATLPEPALPVRLHECRAYRGHSGSFATTLTGLTVRLEDNRAENIEEDFPTPVPFKVGGENMVARIYAFKKGRAETYRKNEGVIFMVNGQTHGIIPKTIFSRKNVKMGSLANSILIIIDSSNIFYKAREDLFKNSRDRLGGGELRKALEEQLEDIIHRHAGLRELREKRKSLEISERLDDSKPLEDVLRSIFRSSPSLSALFLTGSRLPNPRDQRTGGGDKGNGNGTGKGKGVFKGKLNPTFFKFKKKEYCELFHRDCEIGRRCRIDFETDVMNDYFHRASNAGRFILEILEEDWKEEDMDWSLTLHNGMAHASICIPEDVVAGDKFTVQFTVEDDVILDSFVNIAILHVRPRLERRGGGRRKKNSNGGGEGNEPSPAGIELPEYYPVKEKDWDRYDFDRYSACKVVQDEDEHDETKDVYRFYINVDNRYLQTDMKYTNEDARLLEAKFIYGNVLIGLGLIREYREHEKKSKMEDYESDGIVGGVMSNGEFTIEDYVEQTTKALAPFILPMINNLGALSEDDVGRAGQIGDDE